MICSLVLRNWPFTYLKMQFEFTFFNDDQKFCDETTCIMLVIISLEIHNSNRNFVITGRKQVFSDETFLISNSCNFHSKNLCDQGLK